MPYRAGKMSRCSIAALSRLLIILGGCAAASSHPQQPNHDDRELRADPLLTSWEQEEGLMNMLTDKIEATKATTAPTTASPTRRPTKRPTDAPTDNPTGNPTKTPTLSPSESPTRNPTVSPTNQPSISSQPSGEPSANPTASPSMAPSISAMPTTDPTAEPSMGPSNSPSVSTEPTSSPSGSPSSTPTLQPSPSPSAMPSGAPSSTPSSSPSQQPTQSLSPSQLPTQQQIIASTIIIDQGDTQSSTPLLIVGACCAVLMASTSLYLYKRGSMPKRRKLLVAPPLSIDISKDSQNGNGGMVSPYSITDQLGPERVETFPESSGTFDENTQDYENGLMVDVDLDLEVGGQEADVPMEDNVPSSVHVFTETHQHYANNATVSNEVIEPREGSCSIPWMPRSIYVPKLFQRSRSKDAEDKTDEKAPTWNQIREEEGRSSPCSSGYAPASAASPMLSPFFVKGLSNILATPKHSAKNMVIDEIIEEEGTQEGATQASQKSKKKKKKTKKAKREGGAPNSGVHNDEVQNINSMSSDDTPLREAVLECGEDVGFANPQIIDSKVSNDSGSTLEWGIDVSKVPPASKASFESNVAELENLLVGIKSLGSRDARDGLNNAAEVADVELAYSGDSSVTDQKPVHHLALSPRSNASTSYNGTMEIAPMISASTEEEENESTARSDISSVHSMMNSPTYAGGPSANAHVPGITFGRQLLNSSRMSEEGTFNFRNIFNDPKNDLYECHAPSGPLGIVVDTTPLGPRVRSLNPLSPIFGEISPGDVIVGVDEVDTVGMEAGEFWQIVSRKANQQERILTILRI